MPENHVLKLMAKYKNNENEPINLREVIGAILDCNYQHLQEKEKRRLHPYIKELIDLVSEKIAERNPDNKILLIPYLNGLKSPAVLNIYYSIPSYIIYHSTYFGIYFIGFIIA